MHMEDRELIRDSWLIQGQVRNIVAIYDRVTISVDMGRTIKIIYQ